nr:hypothetical protein [Mycoplasmopsis bovis]
MLTILLMEAINQFTRIKKIHLEKILKHFILSGFSDGTKKTKLFDSF